MTLYTDSYDLEIYDSSGTLVKELTDLTETYCSVILPAGDYKAIVYSKNSIMETKSMNAAAFTVEKAQGLLGDVDLDGELSVIDATEIQMHIAKLKALSVEQLDVSDTDKDEELSVLDATQIQRLLAKLITEF